MTRKGGKTIYLWQHQEKALQATDRAISQGKSAGLWVMPTGSGKTVAFATLAARLKLPTLIMVHRAELATQSAEALRICWPEASVSLLQHRDSDQAQAVIATVQRLSRQKTGLIPERFGLIVVDEAHHVGATTWRSTLSHFSPKFLLGCTATPDRLDRFDVSSVFGEVLYRYGLDQAIEDRVVVPILQQGVFTTTSLAEVKVGTNDYSRNALVRAVRCPQRTREVVAGYLPHASRPALVFAADLAHAEELRAELVRCGIRAVAVSGGMSDTQRADALVGFRVGRFDALVSCELLTEGYDERRVACVVMARPTASLALYTQCVGRGIRRDPASGKQDCLVLDVIDKGANPRPIVASSLFGVHVPDCQGRDIRAAAAEEKQRQRLCPVSPSASLAAAWELGKETRWEEWPTLEGYRASLPWHDATASEKQLYVLKGIFRFEPNRELTRGEAAHLIKECHELEELYPTLATSGQKSFLAHRGIKTAGLTKKAAQRMIARVKNL